MTGPGFCMQIWPNSPADRETDDNSAMRRGMADSISARRGRARVSAESVVPMLSHEVSGRSIGQMNDE